MIGRTLSHFKITAKLGEGGMGEVYRAEDTKLGREVAIKVLPSDFVADPQRLGRFEREAKVLATLNHPNIATLHQIEEDGGTHFLVMELVEGRTLAELIPPSGLTQERFFEIAVPLADALASAHAREIIHRDLKPSNVMISDDGLVKVLDFGLAQLDRSNETEATELPTEPMTDSGVVMGTVPYMSPEQLEGKPVDTRTDIFSLGAVLYEMTTGQPPFRGDSPVSVMSAIVRDAPTSVTELKPELPRHLGRILKRALEKNLRRRYQSMLDLRNDLEELWEEVRSGEARPAAPGPVHSSHSRPRLVAAGVLVAFAIAAGTWYLTRTEAKLPNAVEPIATQLTDRLGLELTPSLSPDGRWIAYSAAKNPSGDGGEARNFDGDFDIVLQSIGDERAVGRQEAIRLTAAREASDRDPDISPNGQHVVFASDRPEGGAGGLFVTGITGGLVTRLTDFGFRPSWSPDGSRIAFASGFTSTPEGIARSSEIWTLQPGQQPERLVEANSFEPGWSPDGRWIVYWGTRSGARDLWALPSAGDREPHQLTDDPFIDASPVWSTDDWLYFLSDRGGGSMGIWRAPIDPRSATLTGPPESVRTPTPYAGSLSLSADGRRIAFASIQARSRITRTPIDPTTLEPRGRVETLFELPRTLAALELSPTGEHLAFNTSSMGQEDLYIVRTDGTGSRELTNDPARDRFPRHSPDGRYIAFYSDRGGETWDLWRLDLASGELSPLTTDPDHDILYATWAPDGQQMAASRYSRTVFERSFLFDPNTPWNEQEPVLLPEMADGRGFEPWHWSPDGRWIAGRAWKPDRTVRDRTAVYSVDEQSYRLFGDPSWFALAWFPTSIGWRLAAQTEGGWLEWDPSTGEEIQHAGVPPRGYLISPDGGWLYGSKETWEGDLWALTFLRQ